MLLIAVLSGLGVGSGGLLVIFLTSYLNFAPTDARLTNLLFFIFSSLGAFLVHSRKERIKYKIVLCASVFGILGTLVGTYLGTLFGDTTLKISFGILLLFSGLYGVAGRKIKKILKNIPFFSKKEAPKL